MITVRFPNGQAVQYNDAHYVEHENTFHRLRTKQGGNPIACVPNDCAIEWVPGAVVKAELRKERRKK